MRIAYLGASSGHSEAERTRRQGIVRKLAREAIDIDFLYSSKGPVSIESPEDEQAAIAPIVELAVRYAPIFDAYIITCFGDIGIHELRKTISIPVIAPGRATYSIAAALYPGFSILSLNDAFVEEEEKLVAMLGIRQAVVEIKAVNLRVQEIVQKPDEALRKMRQTVSLIRGEAIVTACMSMAYLLEERGIGMLENKSVVNPIRCGLRLATAMIT